MQIFTGQESPRESRNYQSSATLKDWNIQRAKEILQAGEAHYGEPLKDLIANCHCNWTRTSLAWAVWNETSVPHAWLADHLNMKSAANSSQQIRRFAKVAEKELSVKIRKWKKSRNVA
jgi:putative transposase